MFAEKQDRRRCTFPECGRVHYAKGFCSGHYQQLMRNRPLQPLGRRLPVRAQCDFDTCEKVAVNKGLCQAHATSGRRDNRYARFGRSTVGRAPADSRVVRSLAQLEAIAQDMPRSTTAGDR